MRLVIISFFVLFIGHFSNIKKGFAQEQVLTFGLQFKPIIPTGIAGSGSITFQEDFIEATVNPKLGYSYGGVLRRGITQSISAEIGLNYTKRYYEYFIEDLDSNFSDRTKFGMVNYEIPLQGLVFIQLGEELWMNSSVGLSFDFFASDVQGVGQSPVFKHDTRLLHQFNTAVKANLGLEYRTKKSGYFYLGATFHRPFGNIARGFLTYRKNLIDHVIQTDLNGSYLTLDLRYFFHEYKDRDI